MSTAEQVKQTEVPQVGAASFANSTACLIDQLFTALSENDGLREALIVAKSVDEKFSLLHDAGFTSLSREDMIRLSLPNADRFRTLSREQLSRMGILKTDGDITVSTTVTTSATTAVTLLLASQ